MSAKELVTVSEIARRRSAQMPVGCVKARRENRANARALFESEIVDEGVIGQECYGWIATAESNRTTAPSIAVMPNGRCANDLLAR